jgi:hypothetical protein
MTHIYAQPAHPLLSTVRASSALPTAIPHSTSPHLPLPGQSCPCSLPLLLHPHVRLLPSYIILCIGSFPPFSSLLPTILSTRNVSPSSHTFPSPVITHIVFLIFGFPNNTSLLHCHEAPIFLDQLRLLSTQAAHTGIQVNHTTYRFFLPPSTFHIHSPPT